MEPQIKTLPEYFSECDRPPMPSGEMYRVMSRDEFYAYLRANNLPESSFPRIPEGGYVHHWSSFAVTKEAGYYPNRDAFVEVLKTGAARNGMSLRDASQ